MHANHSPLLWVVRWAETRASFMLADGHTLWFYRSIVGYAGEVIVPGACLGVLLLAMSVRDYGDMQEQSKWRRIYLTYWQSRTVSDTAVRNV